MFEITDANGAAVSWITAKTYEAEQLEIANTQNKATITAGNFELTVKQDLEAMVASSPHTLTIKTTFKNYPVSADALHPTLTSTIKVIF